MIQIFWGGFFLCLCSCWMFPTELFGLLSSQVTTSPRWKPNAPPRRSERSRTHVERKMDGLWKTWWQKWREKRWRIMNQLKFIYHLKRNLEASSFEIWTKQWKMSKFETYHFSLWRTLIHFEDGHRRWSSDWRRAAVRGHARPGHAGARQFRGEVWCSFGVRSMRFSTLGPFLEKTGFWKMFSIFCGFMTGSEFSCCYSKGLKHVETKFYTLDIFFGQSRSAIHRLWRWHLQMKMKHCFGTLIGIGGQESSHQVTDWNARKPDPGSQMSTAAKSPSRTGRWLLHRSRTSQRARLPHEICFWITLYYVLLDSVMHTNCGK